VNSPRSRIVGLEQDRAANIKRCRDEQLEIVSLPETLKKRYPKLYGMGMLDWHIEELMIEKEEKDKPEGYQSTDRLARWHSRKARYVVVEHVDAFIDDLISVCQKHKLSISHEDSHGAFIIEDYSENRADWLRAAHVDTKRRP
jgi:hypothetical protein